jgi:hypothetical protein
MKLEKDKARKLEKDDEALAKMPAIKDELKLFKKEEEHLKNLIRPQRIEVDLKKMEKDRKELLRKEKKR